MNRFASIMALICVPAFSAAAQAAVIFQEEVTGGTLDNSWTQTAGVNFDQSGVKYVSGPASYQGWSDGGSAGASYATSLVLPTAGYELTFNVYPTLNGGAALRPKITFNVQSTAATEVEGYELILYNGSLLLGSRDSGGSWQGTLGSKSSMESALADAWHEWRVNVQNIGGVNNIQVYIDGNLVTWDGDTFSGNSLVTHSGPTGGTIGWGFGGQNRAWVDSILVDDLIPEPASLALVLTGVVLSLSRRTR